MEVNEGERGGSGSDVEDGMWWSCDWRRLRLSEGDGKGGGEKYC